MESFLGKRGTTLSPHFVPVSPPSYKLSRGSCLCVEHSLSLQCQPRAAHPLLFYGRGRLTGDVKGKGASGSNREAESTDVPERDGLPCSSDEAG